MASCGVLENNGNWYGQRMRKGRKSSQCCHCRGPPIHGMSCLFLGKANVYLYCAGSHITVFGSFVMDLYTGSSDLDLSLNVGYAPVERSRSDRIGFLRKLTRALHGLQNGPILHSPNALLHPKHVFCHKGMYTTFVAILQFASDR